MFVQSGFWQCCQTAPVASILMLEGDGGPAARGTAREACASCAPTYARINARHAAELHAAAERTREDIRDIIALLESSPWGNA